MISGKSSIRKLRHRSLKFEKSSPVTRWIHLVVVEALEPLYCQSFRQAGRQLVSSVVPECTSSYALSQLPVFEKLGRNFSHLRLSCLFGKHTRRRTCALLLYLLNGSETKVVGKRHARRENFSLNPFHRCWLLTGLIVVLTDVLMAFRPKVQRKSILGSAGLNVCVL